MASERQLQVPTMPLSAVVGQEEVRRALVMLAVNPRLGGLLIRGEKGTGKSTMARGLPPLLPAVTVVEGCRFGCLAAGPPTSLCEECREQADGRARTRERRPAFATLPLGVTEDQLLGTLDLEGALQRGERRFQPGLLARVNHGVLYVDEVNLLDDHIVDLLLDVAASQVNVVAREGISLSHPARFLLVGTMNPEEGEIRPQLLDRFGLCAEIRSIEDPDLRAEIVARCLAFEADPAGFQASWEAEERALAASIRRARELMPSVTVDPGWHREAARLSLSLEVDGHRPDLMLIKSAITLCALDGRQEVAAADLERAAPLVYAHRLRRHAFDEERVTATELERRARELLRGKPSPEKKKPVT